MLIRKNTNSIKRYRQSYLALRESNLGSKLLRSSSVDAIKNDSKAIMEENISPLILVDLVFRPRRAFKTLSHTRPHANDVFFKLTIWLIALPPLFAYIGTRAFGWSVGAGALIQLSNHALLLVCMAYFLVLIFGFISAAAISRWMSWTYNARHSMGIHFALITVVGAPLAVGSLVHLYPEVLINILVLLPILMWSMYLLYRGLPVALNMNSQQGMLMASAIIGYLLVALVSLIGLTVVLWSYGIGPRVGI